MGRGRVEYQGLEAWHTMTTKNANPLARLKFLNNRKIGQRLDTAFGILVTLTLLVIGLSYLGSFGAIDKITRTDEVRAPAALTASRAQANLLRMLDDVYVYLALGDPHYRDQYEEHSAAFKSDLAELDRLSRFSPDSIPANQA